MPARFPNDNTGDAESNEARRAALDYLYGRVDYEKALSVPYNTRRFKLRRMQRLLELVGNPERGMKIVHVAGTKGKGSTASMLSAMLTAAGFRVGLFTSPHLNRLEERIAVDSRPCSAAELVDLVAEIRPAVACMDREAALQKDSNDDNGDDGPTFFEIMTAMGLLHFARREVDLAVLEVGLGGRLDSTNVCEPVVSAITSISLDHTRQLGNTLAAIAREKAGIIKPGVPVISGVTQPEPRDVIREICRQESAPLTELDRDFTFRYIPPDGKRSRGLDYDSPDRHYSDLRLGLVGPHQATNAAVALAVVDRLRRQGWKIPEEAVRRGLAEVRCPGRVELIGRRPAVVVDTAHNPASIAALLAALDELHLSGRRLLLFAATEDKDLAGMLAALRGRFDRMIFTRYQENPRGVPAQKLAELWTQIGGEPFEVQEKPADAWPSALARAATDDLICVTGSFYLVAELRPTITAFFKLADKAE